MQKITNLLVLVLVFTLTSLAAHAETRFDAINFQPTFDGGRYITVYDAQTWKQWQGSAGLYFDYAHAPLEFGGTFPGARQGIIDRMIVANVNGSIGLADWLSIGANVPVVIYNWFYADTPIAAPTGAADGAFSMGDIEVAMKWRILNNDGKLFGLALVPFVSIPTGDEIRYAGSGKLTGGALLAGEFVFNEKVSLGLNAGARIRNAVVRHGVDMDDELLYSAALNYSATEKVDLIAELNGTTVIKDAFSTSTTSPLEGSGSVRYHVGDTGLSLTAGAGGGIISGVGTPLVRGFAGLNWKSKKMAKVIPVADTRIQGNKIIVWGKIFYDTNKATIKPVSFPTLDEVVDVMVKHPDITMVEVQGHTDARASDAYNLKLSQARAAAAMQYLISKGIAATRLTAVGYGESKPIADNTTQEGMSQNRRTEFVILARTEK